MQMIAAAAADAWPSLWDGLIAPLRETPWAFWRQPGLRDFWLGKVFDDRLRVVYTLPLMLVLVLLALRGRALKIGLIVAGLIFLGYNFGLLYPVFWLLLCVVFYWLTERFAVECKRADVLPIGPPLAALGCVLAVNLLVALLGSVQLPPALLEWLRAHAGWLWPLGLRPWGWEPRIAWRTTPQLLGTVFALPHYIGTAYFTVRMLHYFSELKRDTIPRERRSLLNFMTYLCYGPTIMQGPIERYPRFLEEIDSCHTRRSWANVPPAAWRIGLGIFKSLVSTWYFTPFLWYYRLAGEGAGPAYWERPEDIDSYLVVYGGVFAVIFALYLDFSGYCDVAAGVSRLLGYRPVENFNWPWLSTSMRDFWRRWHISLSFILRDYVYIPLGGSRGTRWRVFANTVITFALCGIWHEPIFKMLLWGAVMGAMVYVNHEWHNYAKRLDATPTGWRPALRRGWLRLWPLPQVCAWACTINLFVLSLLFFFGGERGFRVLWELLRRPANGVIHAFGGPTEALHSLNALLGL
jgi:D-alanyl-lipoteichoic acid acyltransferase DltB (MBOAT superfamily)